MKLARAKVNIRSPISEGKFDWDQLPENPEEKAKEKQFKELLISHTKKPQPGDIEKLLRLASETGLDKHPLDWLPVKFNKEIAHPPTYYERLLKGKKDSNRYIRLSKELYAWGYEQEAIDYLKKGIGEERSPEKRLNLIHLRDALEIGWKYIGADRLLKKLISKAAKTDIDILIEGETGTGKEIVADLIHSLSMREGPFIAISCAEIPPTLVESELFGHMKGSFTDAKNDHAGIFESGDKGTVFLDELNELAPHLQAKLLRFLQNREIRPIGSNKPKEVDVRVLYATNQNALEMVRNGGLRPDLYFRIKAFKISLPPLRERRGIISELARHFMKKYQGASQKLRTLTQGAVTLLGKYPWPGNVRELENSIRGILCIAEGEKISADDLAKYLNPFHESTSLLVLNSIRGVLNLAEGEKITVDHLAKYLNLSHESSSFSVLCHAIAEKWTIKKLKSTYEDIVLKEVGGSSLEASKILGVNLTTVNRIKTKRPNKTSS